MSALELAAKAPSLPIAFGSVAFLVGRNRLLNADHTHRWMVFVRGAHNQDITYAVSRVVFVLHSSYQDFRRGALRSAHHGSCNYTH